MPDTVVARLVVISVEVDTCIAFRIPLQRTAVDAAPSVGRGALRG